MMRLFSKRGALKAQKPTFTLRRAGGRASFTLFVILIAAFFALPMLWLVFAPFDLTPSLTVKLPHLSLGNFREMSKNPLAMKSLVSSMIFSVGTGLLVIFVGAPASYALSRVKFVGRDVFLYILLLFSSVVTGTAAMVPIFLLALRLGLINTYYGVILVLAGGLLPSAIFILKDFTDSTPKSYEESARIFGASSMQILRSIVIPIIRPGLAVIFVWTFVNAWGNFLVPFLLMRDSNSLPASVLMFSFYTEGGQAIIRTLAAFALLYTLPVVLMYLYVNKRYGFRFYGGIKG
jgi:multiple sugar transport system permease protein